MKVVFYFTNILSSCILLNYTTFVHSIQLSTLLFHKAYFFLYGYLLCWLSSVMMTKRHFSIYLCAYHKSFLAEGVCWVKVDGSCHTLWLWFTQVVSKHKATVLGQKGQELVIDNVVWHVPVRLCMTTLIISAFAKASIGLIIAHT